MSLTIPGANKNPLSNESSRIWTQAAYYARVSSEQQADEATIESQISAIHERIAADGLKFEEILGFLDDAIMIELCVRELQHEIEAYEDFIEYRKDEAQARGVDPASLKTQRHEWAEARRVELIDRMRKRRGQSYQSSGGWKPTLFSFRGCPQPPQRNEKGRSRGLFHGRSCRRVLEPAAALRVRAESRQRGREDEEADDREHDAAD